MSKKNKKFVKVMKLKNPKEAYVYENKYKTVEEFNDRLSSGLCADRYYFAYGSNMDLNQMAFRCPNSRYEGIGYIHNQRLVFKNTFATIIPSEGDVVPIVIYRISKADEDILDKYEHVPNSYYKITATLAIDNDYGNQIIEGLLYVMQPVSSYSLPSNNYYNLIKSAYSLHGIDESILIDAMKFTFDKQYNF